MLAMLIKSLSSALFILSTMGAGLCQTTASAPTPQAKIQVQTTTEPTRILDKDAAQRLIDNKGLTLQWIDWNTRGSAYIRPDGETWKLRGAQFQAGGQGSLFLDGIITEIGADYFTFQGKIRIANSPDQGRICEKDKIWHFAVTQDRPYYRLREFEWCDGLTDYIDLYF